MCLGLGAQSAPKAHATLQLNRRTCVPPDTKTSTQTNSYTSSCCARLRRVHTLANLPGIHSHAPFAKKACWTTKHPVCAKSTPRSTVSSNCAAVQRKESMLCGCCCMACLQQHAGRYTKQYTSPLTRCKGPVVGRTCVQKP
jgi:hypothetical protein